MASFKFAIYWMCLLSGANSVSINKYDAAIGLDVPKECIGKDFCSVLPGNYEQIHKRIEELMPEHMLAEMQKRLGTHDKNTLKYSTKEDWHNCPTSEKVESPNIAQDPKDTNNYHAVVQLHNKFEQQFLAVRCPNPEIAEISNNSANRQCFPDVIHISRHAGMESTCVQREAKRLLYIYNHEKDILEMKSYRVPVHCSCKLASSSM